MKIMTASAVKKNKKGALKAMHIKFVGGGATSQAEHASPMGGTEMGPEMIHPSQSHLQKHVKAMSSDHFAANTGMGAGMADMGGGATQPTSTPGPMDTNEGM